MTHSHPAQPTRSRWVAPAALVIAVIAIGVAIWALVRSPDEPAPSPGDPAVNAQQSDDAKGRVCAAFDIVRRAVSMQTNIDMGPESRCEGSGGGQRPPGDAWGRRISAFSPGSGNST